MSSVITHCRRHRAWDELGSAPALSHTGRHTRAIGCLLHALFTSHHLHPFGSIWSWPPFLPWRSLRTPLTFHSLGPCLLSALCGLHLIFMLFSFSSFHFYSSRIYLCPLHVSLCFNKLRKKIFWIVNTFSWFKDQNNITSLCWQGPFSTLIIFPCHQKWLPLLVLYVSSVSLFFLPISK